MENKIKNKPLFIDWTERRLLDCIAKLAICEVYPLQTDGDFSSKASFNSKSLKTIKLVEATLKGGGIAKNGLLDVPEYSLGS